jgi:hypothetical protein
MRTRAVGTAPAAGGRGRSVQAEDIGQSFASTRRKPSSLTRRSFQSPPILTSVLAASRPAASR